MPSIDRKPLAEAVRVAPMPSSLAPFWYTPAMFTVEAA